MKRLFTGLALLALVLGCYANDVFRRSGPVRTIFPTAALTNVYTSSQPIDLNTADGAGINLSVGTVVDPAVTVSLKYQWSDDSTAWEDGQVLVTGTASATEQPYTALTRVVQVNCTNGVTYVENVMRVKRWFRCQVKGSAVTTGTVSIVGVSLNNN